MEYCGPTDPAGTHRHRQDCARPAHSRTARQSALCFEGDGEPARRGRWRPRLSRSRCVADLRYPARCSLTVHPAARQARACAPSDRSRPARNAREAAGDERSRSAGSAQTRAARRCVALCIVALACRRRCRAGASVAGHETHRSCARDLEGGHPRLASRAGLDPRRRGSGRIRSWHQLPVDPDAHSPRQHARRERAAYDAEQPRRSDRRDFAVAVRRADRRSTPISTFCTPASRAGTSRSQPTAAHCCCRTAASASRSTAGNRTRARIMSTTSFTRDSQH